MQLTGKMAAAILQASSGSLLQRWASVLGLCMKKKQNDNTIEDALPVVLVLGDFAHEGLSAKIESLGFKVINKRLRSSVNNWKTIIEILRKHITEKRLALVFGYLPTPTLLLVAEEQYDEVRIPLITELERANTLLFVYEDNLSGTVEPIPWELPDTTEEELEHIDIP